MKIQKRQYFIIAIIVVPLVMELVFWMLFNPNFLNHLLTPH